MCRRASQLQRAQSSIQKSHIKHPSAPYGADRAARLLLPGKRQSGLRIRIGQKAYVTVSWWNRREGGRAQPLKRITWPLRMQHNWLKDLDSSEPWASLNYTYTHCNTLLLLSRFRAKWHTHRRHDSSGKEAKKWAVAPILEIPIHSPK